MSSVLREMIGKRRQGIAVGIPSYCTANELAIEALLAEAKERDDDILIEATANQVNQFGGYTGMKPVDFRDFVYSIADRIGFSKDRITLGGDHLGPLTWVSEPESSAMEKSKELVKLFVEAGFKKIHLDTSMRLGDDPTDKPLSDEVIAKRGAILFKVCKDAIDNMRKSNPKEEMPVFIIGSEVPIPGGAQEEEDSVAVTSPKAASRTLDVYRQEFEKAGLSDGFSDVIAIVVQPGVEFGDDDVFYYNRENAKELCAEMDKYPDIVMEGHSTDYQRPMGLRQMVEDGVGILKVGPELTFALRDGLFALGRIEEALIPEGKRVDFETVLENIMLEDPSKWQKYYHGSDAEIALKRKYSFSDRCRYYFADQRIIDAINKLIDNVNSTEIPLGLLYQYMPRQYQGVRDGRLKKEAKAMLLDFVTEVAENYNFACGKN